MLLSHLLGNEEDTTSSVYRPKIVELRGILTQATRTRYRDIWL